MASTKTSFPTFLMDTRALASFRILLGLYLLYDIYARLSLGKYDLAWYTSIPADRSFLKPNDTPHKAPLHLFWFYRGSAAFQIAIYTLTAILSLCFCLGWKCHGILKTALWILQVAQHNRNMVLTDGSDSFVRHLLLWCCFLPLTEHWSIDAVVGRRHRQINTHGVIIPSSNGRVVSGLPCLAIVVQIVLMYAGTVFHYTTDMLGGFNNTNLKDLVWLPPELSAVHYALSGAFATRHNVLTAIVRSNPTVSRTLTALVLLVVCVAPLACLFLPAATMTRSSLRQWPALILVLCHASLCLFRNLPNWELVGMLCQVLWVPSAVWNQWGFASGIRSICNDGDSGGNFTEETTIYKKTDGDDSNPAASKVAVSSIEREQMLLLHSNPVSRFLQYFLYMYMIYNWLGTRGWIAKLDNGDIAEGLRLSQHFIMDGATNRKSFTIQLNGLLPSHVVIADEPTRLDLLYFIQTGRDRIQDPADFVPQNMSSRYPSPRWERSLSRMAASDNIARASHLCQVLCNFVNEDRRTVGAPTLSHIEMVWQRSYSEPPGSERRYAKRIRPHDTIVEVECT
jgi:hypothetical protein